MRISGTSRLKSASVLLICLSLFPHLRIDAQTIAGTPIAKEATPPSDIEEFPASSDRWIVSLLGIQFNAIGQDLRPFKSSYASVNSLRSDGDSKISHAYGLYVGAQAGKHLQGYLDIEMVRGKGISSVTGLAGPTNGDVLRQGTVDLGNGPYVARAFVRYIIPLQASGQDTIQRDIDQMPSITSGNRLEVSAGKLAASDLFDLNRYANSTRQQFLNWDLFQNTAWDFAADTRGYTNGVALSWIHPIWTLKVGSFQMPKFANGNIFDSNLGKARGDHVELTLTAQRTGTIGRFLGFLNHARMGSYADALAQGRRSGAPPNIVADDTPGRTKYGYGVNVEQPLADDGETGAFARLGWNDGKNESFAFTEVDRHVSGGVQVSGAHWQRHDDRLGVAFAQTGIVQAHRDYLNAGGLGFLLGDGKLNYGPEELLEAYYRAQLGRYFRISPDLQYIRDPGYNRDRGPVTVLSLRVNVRY
jgi:high affinity Mn2+ porin